MKDCQKEDREDVTREDEDRWCQKQVQVLNAIFRPVRKLSSSFLGDRIPAGVQEWEEVFNNVPETVRQDVMTFRNQYRYFY